LNVDAAGPTEDGRWGLLAVIRDSNRVVMAAACWFCPMLHDLDIVEGLAMSLGLNFAKDMIFLNIEAESDSANLIEALKDNKV